MSESKYDKAIRAFDEANRQDPNKETVNGKEVPKELIYGERMTEELQKLDPDASEALRLAARSQHIERWKIPRSEYPKTRRGYHKWRNALKKFHAERAGEILEEVGYDQETIDRVQDLVKKKRIKTDPEAQMMEDVICLVFMKYYFLNFAQKHPEEKVIKIVRKTWKKMSEEGHKATMNLELPDEAAKLVEKADLSV